MLHAVQIMLRALTENRHQEPPETGDVGHFYLATLLSSAGFGTGLGYLLLGSQKMKPDRLEIYFIYLFWT